MATLAVLLTLYALPQTGHWHFGASDAEGRVLLVTYEKVQTEALSLDLEPRLSLLGPEREVLDTGLCSDWVGGSGVAGVSALDLAADGSTFAVLFAKTDGSRVLFQGQVAADGAMTVGRIVGSPQNPPMSETPSLQSPRLSPDGDWLAWHVRTYNPVEGNFRSDLMLRHEGKTVKIEGGMPSVAFSRDSKRLAYLRHGADRYQSPYYPGADLVVRDLETGHEAVLASGYYPGLMPDHERDLLAWSTDGTSLFAVAEEPHGRRSVAIMANRDFRPRIVRFAVPEAGGSPERRGEYTEVFVPDPEELRRVWMTPAPSGDWVLVSVTRRVPKKFEGKLLNLVTGELREGPKPQGLGRSLVATWQTGSALLFGRGERNYRIDLDGNESKIESFRFCDACTQ